MSRRGLPHDSSTDQDQEHPSGYYSRHDPQQPPPTRHNRAVSHQSTSDITPYLGGYTGPLHGPQNTFEDPYASTSIQPDSLTSSTGHFVAQSRDYRDTTVYPSQVDNPVPYYAQADRMPDGSSRMPYHPIQNHDGGGPMLHPTGAHGHESIADWRRSTITQQGYQDELAQRSAKSQPSANPAASYPTHLHRTDISRLETPEHHQPPGSRQHRGNYAPYERRETIRPSTLAHAAAVQGFQLPPRTTSPGVAPEYGSSSGYSGSIAIPQLPPMNSSTTHSQGFPIAWPEPGQMSQSLPPPSPSPLWANYSMSNVGTPAPTEGSADPAQSDQEEPDALTATSPTTSNSTSNSVSSTASRWARFRVPPDIFTNPPDPARHELYHRIRLEPWFVQQVTERSLAAYEAERIPGSAPGESVLLAFYDRILDNANKIAMKCTICAQTNPGAQLYPRPDRAKVHMRHHFELRPIRCNGTCNSPQCGQRFFTHSDLTAHVTGKTEPLATCPRCGKTMRQKNLKRHMSQYCQSLNTR